jgi:hypothetical protein
MTGSEYQKAIERLGMTTDSAAHFLGIDPTTSRRWIKDPRPIPHSAALLLRVMLRYRLSVEAVRRANATQ